MERKEEEQNGPIMCCVCHACSCSNSVTFRKVTPTKMRSFCDSCYQEYLDLNRGNKNTKDENSK